MSNIKKYNFFLFFSSISRNIIEVFSAVFLYKRGYDIKDIILFYLLLYLFGIIINTISIVLSKYINKKYILIFSTLMYSFSFYYLSNMDTNFINLLVLSLILSLSSFTYHSMRHDYALEVIENNKKEIGNILISMYIGVMLSSYLSSFIINKFGFVIINIFVIIMSFLGIVFLFLMKSNNNIKKIKIDIKSIKNKIPFFIFEQFKVIFLILQPLYLYIFINNNIEYIGIYNAVISFACLICIYFFIKKIDHKKCFKILNIIFCLVLILKINITGKYILLLIAFLEGLGIKIYEVVSTNNMYGIKNIEKKGYLIVVEIIFCLIRSIILILFLFIKDLKIMLYISILGIFISGFLISNKGIDKNM